MISQVKRIALYGMAIAAGAAAFVFVWNSHASAAVNCPTICYQGRTYNNVPTTPINYQALYLGNGGLCGACGSVSPN